MKDDYQSIGSRGGEKPGFIQRYALIWLIGCCVFTLATIALGVSFAVMMGHYADQKVPAESVLPRVRAVDDVVDASAKYDGHFDRSGLAYRYHRLTNFYNKKPTKTIHLLEKFKTYQQTNGWGCGAASALMALNHLGETNISEHVLAKEIGHAKPGAQVTDILKAYKNRNYQTISSLDHPLDTSYFTKDSEFTGNVTAWLDKKIPIMVKLGGHWSVIIGYDPVGMPTETQNHVLILADSWDTHDFHQDGYIVYTFDYFWNLWSNVATTTESTNADIGAKYQQFVVGWK